MPEYTPPSSAAPPWSSQKQWNEANLVLSGLIRHHPEGIVPVERKALRILAMYLELFPLMNRLCASTCPSCSEPCCRRARVWIDFTDLLFLHLTKSPLPLVQLIPDTSRSCTFAGPEGCLLPRLARPWICLWYLCPPQKELLRSRPGLDRIVHRHIRRIKAGRRSMEESFVRLVSGLSPFFTERAMHNV